jgi:hypothetical protein
MHARRLAALVLVVLTAAAFAAAPPPRPLGPAELQRLIEQLGDRDYRARDTAERRIVAEGNAALPLLRKAMGHKDPEVRRRALRLVPGLEHAAIVAPKRVTMMMHNQPISAVFAEISKQTGYQIQHQGVNGMMVAGAVARAVGKVAKGKAAPAAPKEPLFSYTFVNEPFWEVIDRICRDCNLYVQQGYGDEIVRLYQGNHSSPYAGRDGAFRYAATNLYLSRTIDLNNPGTPSRNESLTLNLTLFAEPRLPFLNMGEPRIEAAYDSEKNSMIPKNAGGQHDEMNGWGGMRISRRYYGGGYKQMSMQVGMNLIRVSEKASSIKLIRGVVPCTLLVDQKPMTLSDDIMKAKGKKQTIGELEFTIEDVQKQPNSQYSVKFSVANKGNPNDYTWQNTLYNRLELMDAKGNKYQNWGSSWHGGGGNSVSMTLTYNGSNANPNKPGDAKKFVYQHWVTKQHDVHFELRDVPLP